MDHDRSITFISGLKLTNSSRPWSMDYSSLVGLFDVPLRPDLFVFYLGRSDESHAYNVILSLCACGRVRKSDCTTRSLMQLYSETQLRKRYRQEVE